MGIFYHQFTAFGAAAQPMHAAAVQLATACAQHFAMIAAWHIGIGNSSCRAAVAVNSPFYPAIIGQPFGAMYGNSQLAIQAIALGHGGAALGGHAERAALSAGAIPGLPPCRYTRLSRALEICKRFYMLILHLVLIVSFGSTDWGEVCQTRITVLSMG